MSGEADGHPEHEASSTDATPLSKLEKPIKTLQHAHCFLCKIEYFNILGGFCSSIPQLET
jgi:hypothetical protein